MLVDAPPATGGRVICTCDIVIDVDTVVGQQLLAGVFVAVGGGVGRLGHGHAVGVVVGRLLEFHDAFGVAAHHGADVALPVAHVDVRAEAVAVAGRGVETAEPAVYVFVSSEVFGKSGVVEGNHRVPRNHWHRVPREERVAAQAVGTVETRVGRIELYSGVHPGGQLRAAAGAPEAHGHIVVLDLAQPVEERRF